MRYIFNVKRFIIATAASILVTIGFAAPALAAAFTNGSFETGTDPGSFAELSSGDSTSIPGWTVSPTNIDYIGTYWTASNGMRSLDLSGSNAGDIQQTFDTVAGHTYLVAFDLAGNPDGLPTTKTLTVAATGGPTTPYSFDVTGHTKTSMGWQPQVYSFIATGASTILTFTSTTATAFGPALDNVVVTDTTSNTTTVIKIKNHNHVTVTNTNTQTSTSGKAVVKNNTTGGNATSGSSSNTNSSTTTITINNNPTF
jgi:choice-of-anchor C domain-containing protein